MLKLFAAACVATAVSLSAFAQEKTTDNDVKDGKPTAGETKPYEIKRLIIGKSVVINKEFADKNGIPEPSPFSITIPTGEDFLTLLDTKKGGFLKVTFASPDREFLESVQFVDMEVPADLKEKRTPAIAQLMSQKVFVNATKDLKDAKVLAIRETEIGGLGAVEVIGRYTDADSGLIYLWIFGLPHPVNSKGTYAIATLHFGRRPIVTDQDFRNTLAGRAIFSFQYIE